MILNYQQDSELSFELPEGATGGVPQKKVFLNFKEVHKKTSGSESLFE